MRCWLLRFSYLWTVEAVIGLTWIVGSARVFWVFYSGITVMLLVELICFVFSSSLSAFLRGDRCTTVRLKAVPLNSRSFTGATLLFSTSEHSVLSLHSRRDSCIYELYCFNIDILRALVLKKLYGLLPFDPEAMLFGVNG